MSDQIILEFIADPSGLKPATDALRDLSRASDENMAAFYRANQALQGTPRLVNENLDAFSKLSAVIASTTLSGLVREYDVWAKMAAASTNQVRDVHQGNEKDMTEATKRALAERSAAERSEVDKRKETMRTLSQTAMSLAREVAQSIFAIEVDARQQKLNERIKLLEGQKSAELQNKDLTENQKKQIEARYRQEEARAKLQSWKADQEGKVGQALINGFLGATTTIAEMGIPAGLIGAASALAYAAVQASAIGAQRPPNYFARGTRSAPRGLAWVGEEGPELMYMNGGEKVITHPDSLAIMRSYDLDKHLIPSMPLLTDLKNERTGQTNEVVTAISKLSHEIKNLKQVTVSVDKAGIQVLARRGNHRTEYLNNKIDL